MLVAELTPGAFAGPIMAIVRSVPLPSSDLSRRFGVTCVRMTRMPFISPVEASTNHE
jgi:hypothetical protein